MSRKERERLVVFSQVKQKELSRVEGAQVLGISLRQMHRQYVRWRDEGDKGLLHQSRGRVSPRRTCEREKSRALALYQEQYLGFGPTLLSEKLELHGIWLETAIELGARAGG